MSAPVSPGSGLPHAAPAPRTGPRIPPAPPPAKPRRDGDGRWIIWLAMSVLGAIVGTAFYQWLPAMTASVDAWVTPLLR